MALAERCVDVLSIRNPAVKELLRLRIGRRRAREQKGLVLVRGRKVIQTIGEFFKFKKVLTYENPDAFGQYNAESVVRTDKAILKHILFSQNWEAQRKYDRLARWDNEDELIVGSIEQPSAASFGIAAADRGLPSADDGGSPPVRRLLAIDGVKHPENMGMLLSTAVALRYSGVFLCGNCVDPFNHKVLEVSQAVAWTMPYRYGTVDDLMAVCARHQLAVCASQSAAAAAEGGGPPPLPVAELPSLDDRRFGGFCLAVGSEAKGVSPELLSKCTRIALPMSELTESLNAGVAGGILMHALACAWAAPS